MKIYLAARYSRIEELNAYRAELEAWGHTVTSRWLNGEHQIHGYEAARAVERNELDSCPESGALFAGDDVEDLTEAEIVIAFSEQPRNGNTGRGGRHVELGLALAMGKRIILIGPRENVFHCLPQVEHWADWAAFRFNLSPYKIGNI
jgi:hypothetical protein